MRAAIINKKTKEVVNIVEVDSKSDFAPEDGLRLIRLGDDTPCRPGWHYNGNSFFAPEVVDPEPQPAPQPVADPKAELAKEISNARNLEHLKQILIRGISAL